MTILSLGCAQEIGTVKQKYPIHVLPDFPSEIQWGTDTNELGEKYYILIEKDYFKLKEWAKKVDLTLWKYHCAFREINGRPCPAPQ